MTQQPFGRIALRREGKWWCAYFAATDTMAGAVPIARIRMHLAELHPEVKDAFIALTRTVVECATKSTIGSMPEWQDPEPAPESERSGDA